MAGVFIVALRGERLELVVDEERPGRADVEFAELGFGEFIGGRHVQRLESLAGDVDAGVRDKNHVRRHSREEQRRKLARRGDASGRRQRRVGIGGEISDRHLIDEGRSRPGRIDAPKNRRRAGHADQRELFHLDVVDPEGETRQGLRGIDGTKRGGLGGGRLEIGIGTGALPAETGHTKNCLDDPGGGGALRGGTEEREERRGDEGLGICAAEGEFIADRPPANAVFRDAGGAGVGVFFVSVGGRKFEQAHSRQVCALARHGYANLGEAGVDRPAPGNGIEKIPVLPASGGGAAAEGIFIGGSDEFLFAKINAERGAKRTGGQIEQGTGDAGVELREPRLEDIGGRTADVVEDGR